MRRHDGFTLIELMIVVLIIAIILGIALPNLLRSRMTANEATATGSMRTISTGESSYQSAGIDATTNGIGKYATLSSLGTGTVPFIDAGLASGAKSGYLFEATPALDSGTIPRYSATGSPAVQNKTGFRAYFVDETGVIRFEGGGGTPTSTSPPIS